MFRHLRVIWLCFWLAGLCGGQAAALDQPAPVRPLPINERRALEAYDKAMAGTATRGFDAISANAAALREALSNAPASYPVIERRADGNIVRADTMEDAVRLTAGLFPDMRSFRVERNTYPLIALVLGAEAVERRRYSDAISLLDQGLALQPNHPVLVAEKAAALFGLRRWNDALILVDRTLASGDRILQLGTAPLHRRRGFALVELGKLQDAKLAYEQSLELEPGNSTAVSELAYIDDLLAGEARRDALIVAPNMADSEETRLKPGAER